MTQDLEYRVAELERKLLGMIRYATVETQEGDRVTVKSGDLVTGKIPWLSHRAGPDKEWWAPEKNEQVLLLCPCGDPALGVALPSIYRDLFPAPADAATVRRTTYADGAVTEYDRETHILKANIPGSIIAIATKTIEATAPDIKLTGSVFVEGPIHATEAITSDDSMGAPDMAAAGSISAPSIKANGDEVTDHDHECPHGGRTSILGE